MRSARFWNPSLEVESLRAMLGVSEHSLEVESPMMDSSMLREVLVMMRELLDPLREVLGVGSTLWRWRVLCRTPR